MGKPKKERELTQAEKKCISLSLKENNINYNEVFASLALELDLPEELIRDYANQVNNFPVDESLPPEPKREVGPLANHIRDLFTPNRNKEPNKARHVTIMCEAASDVIKDMPVAKIKGSSKTRDAIFRQ